MSAHRFHTAARAVAWAAVFALAACSSSDGDREQPVAAKPSDAARPVPPPPDAVPPRPDEPPPPPLADVIAAARDAAAGIDIEVDDERGPTVTLYRVGHEHPDEIETGDVWLKFQVSLYRSFRRCYRRLLRKEKGLAGRVTIQMEVQRGGSVAAPRVTDSFDDRIDDCLERYASGWKFPVLADDGGAVLTLEVGFRP